MTTTMLPSVPTPSQACADTSTCTDCDLQARCSGPHVPTSIITATSHVTFLVGPVTSSDRTAPLDGLSAACEDAGFDLSTAATVPTVSCRLRPSDSYSRRAVDCSHRTFNALAASDPYVIVAVGLEPAKWFYPNWSLFSDRNTIIFAPGLHRVLGHPVVVASMDAPTDTAAKDRTWWKRDVVGPLSAAISRSKFEQDGRPRPDLFWPGRCWFCRMSTGRMVEFDSFGVGACAVHRRHGAFPAERLKVRMEDE